MDFNVLDALSIKDNFVKYKNVKSQLIKGEPFTVKPKYSIVIPTFKRVSTLKETLESARAQDYSGDYDIIVCDNNPEHNDDTEIYIHSIIDKRVLYYKNDENIGMTGNWNRCIELCDGKYMVMIHDDDILYPYFLSKCDEVLNKNPEIDFLFPSKNCWNQSKDAHKPKGVIDTKGKLYRLSLLDYFLDNADAPTGILLKKDAADHLGGFAEEAYPAADLYFNIKAVMYGIVYRYSKPLSIYCWGINESMKLNTLKGFVEVYNPLRIIIGKELHIPFSMIKILNRNYSLQNFNIAKEVIPSEQLNSEINSFDLPKSEIEVNLSRIICKIIYYILALRHITSVKNN